ncbi:MAG: hypothetical protein JNM84_18215 [Planctomycetes bacterium]|nr:hypothetical protein [Planctomycetota bacterium]
MTHTSRALLPALALALLGSTAYAQNVYPLAYPQATTTESSGNILPFGILNANTNFDESRYQILIPATHLPTTPAAIVGLEVNSQVWTGTLIYANYEITLSNTTATGLSSALDTNLPAPTPVLALQGTGIAFTSRQWAPVPFQTPFLHNGTGALVIDLKKRIDRSLLASVPGVVTMETTGSPARNDLPIGYGAAGPGAFNATTASFGYSSFLKVRLLVQDVPTVDLLSNVFTSNNTSGVFRIGGSATVNLHSVSGSPYLVFAESAFIAPAALPPIQGALVVLPLTILFSGTTGAGDLASFSAGIPNLSILVGGRVTFQGVAVQNGVPFFTNGCDAIINS